MLDSGRTLRLTSNQYGAQRVADMKKRMDTGKKLENYLREVCRKVGIRDGKCRSVHELRHALLDYFRADEETVRAKRERRQQPSAVASTERRTADYSCVADDEW